MAFLRKTLSRYRVALYAVSEGCFGNVEFAVAGLLAAMSLEQASRSIEAAVLAGRFAGDHGSCPAGGRGVPARAGADEHAGAAGAIVTRETGTLALEDICAHR